MNNVVEFCSQVLSLGRAIYGNMATVDIAITAYAGFPRINGIILTQQGYKADVEIIYLNAKDGPEPFVALVQEGPRRRNYYLREGKWIT